MTTEQKQETVAAVKAYMAEKKLSMTDFVKLSGVNARYVSEILRGATHTMVGEKQVAIHPKWFSMMAKAAQHRIEKAYWKTVLTDQFVEIISLLESHKANGTSGMIIGDTGTGKTNAVERFIAKHPQHTYRITVSKLHTLPFILEQLLEKFGLNEKGRSANKLERIVQHLRRLKHEGERVIIIFDEAENFRTPVFGMVKAMYDGILDYASITLVGTSELTEKMERMKRKNRDGMPQFCRRFKAGTRYLQQIDRYEGFELFYTEMGIKDKGLRELLNNIADNYGELHDYLEPALREADARGEALTEDFFRIMYNLPKRRK